MPSDREAEVLHGRRSLSDGGASDRHGTCAERVTRVPVFVVRWLAFNEERGQSRKETSLKSYAGSFAISRFHTSSCCAS
jgi:hypothetical protein